MRFTSRLLGLSIAASFAALALIAACGSRTGLGLLGNGEDLDGALDALTDTSHPDGPMLHDGHGLDVFPECATPTYCVPNDPNYIYKCGVRVFECSSLEQCEEPCGDAQLGDACAAQCVNPCLNSLGQNTSNGCEFYAVEMDMSETSVGVCYAVFIVNQWQTGQPAKLEVQHGTTVLPIEQFARIPSGTGTHITYAPFDSATGLPQNKIAVLFLSRDPTVIQPGSINPSTLANCPPGVVPAIVGDAALHGTGTGTAFHIKSNVPVVAYQMLPYGGGHARVTGATLLLPTNVWGTNYLAANAYSFPPMIDCYLPDGGPDGCTPNSGPTLAVIAQQDNTHVTIKPVAGIAGGGGLPGAAPQTSVTYTVNQGEYLQFSQIAELTGSPIESDAPIAVVGGDTLIDLPTSVTRADGAEQMLSPISALGHEYVAVRYRSRNAPLEESVPWRLVGVVDGTTLTYDPAPPPGAPSVLNHGQVVEIDDPGPWVVASQDAEHPFYFAQYMTGGDFLTPDASADGVDSGLYGQGDPEFVNVITPAQYLPGYTFFTDPTYPETNLVIVAAQDSLSGQFPTVNLDCAGVLSGWQPVGTSGKYQFTRLDLSSGNYQGQNGCNNGVHTIQASFTGDAAAGTPLIGVTVWGWGSRATYPYDRVNTGDQVTDESDPNFTLWVSYGYPAGANITKLNSVVFPAH